MHSLLAVAGLLMLPVLTGCAGDSSRQTVIVHGTAPETVALPALSELKGSACLYPHYDLGAELVDSGGDAELAGEQLRLGSAAAGGGSAPLSFGIYAREVDGQPTGASFTVAPALALPEPGPFWVGLSNFAAGHWELFGPYTVPSDTLTYPAPSGYMSPDGRTYIAVVTAGGSGLTVETVEVATPGGTDGPPADGLALTVGPGKTFSRVEDALAAATAGAHIKIYCQAGNAPYDGTALFVDTPHITFWGIRGPANERPRLSGAGFDYSGVGSTPRAIFQFQPEADGCVVNGLELYDAHNASFNGAGVRVNQAAEVVVEDCVIHGCDMGVMSNGQAAVLSGSVSLLHCLIHSNGSLADPGFNHNIYAGGTRLTMEGCEVYGSLTGHNVKSRAHINELRCCFVHDSANREFDLVDEAGNTGIPGSYSLLSGCVIEKAEGMSGNKNVIHFGQDGGGGHDGTLYLCNCTVTTPYISPVVLLSAPQAKAAIFNTIVWDAASGQNNQSLVEVTGGALIGNAAGQFNWLSSGFSLPAGGSFDAASNHFGADGVDPPFLNGASSDYHLSPAFFEHITDAGETDGGFTPVPDDGLGGVLYILPFEEYRAPWCTGLRPQHGLPDLGAFESEYAGP